MHLLNVSFPRRSKLGSVSTGVFLTGAFHPQRAGCRAAQPVYRHHWDACAFSAADPRADAQPCLCFSVLG